VLSVSCDRGDTPSDTEMPTIEAAIGSSDSTKTEIMTEIETETTAPRDPTAYTDGLILELGGAGNLAAEVRFYDGTEVDVVIPSYYKGVPVTNICNGAFSSTAYSSHGHVNSQIESVYLPDTLIYIGEDAFFECDKLKSIHIPASVRTIEQQVFEGCTALESITVEEGNRFYRGEGNCLMEIATGKSMAGCRNSVIPDDAEIATGKIMAGCRNSVIPDDGTVRSIGYRAFYKQDQLTEIAFPSSLKIIEDEAFAECTTLKHVTGAEGLQEIGRYAFQNCRKLLDIPFCEGLKIISDEAFLNCQSLTAIRFPNSIEKVTFRVFSGCTGIREVILPAQEGSLGMSLFDYATSLKSVTIPEGYTYIGETFTDSGLEEVHLPSTMKEILNYAFRGCNSLHDVYYNGTKEQWLELVKDGNFPLGAEYFTLHCTDGDSLWEKQFWVGGFKEVPIVKK